MLLFVRLGRHAPRERFVIASAAKQSRVARDSRQAALDCFVAIAPRNDEFLFTSPAYGERSSERSERG